MSKNIDVTEVEVAVTEPRYMVHWGVGIHCTLHNVDWLFCFCGVEEIKQHYIKKSPCHKNCETGEKWS